MINICLDDQQGVVYPDGFWHQRPIFSDDVTLYKLVRTCDKCKTILEENRGNVGILTLDYDLSYADDPGNSGMTILEWLEDKVYFEDDLSICPKVINLHSNSSTSAREMFSLAKHIAKKAKFEVTMHKLV